MKQKQSTMILNSDIKTSHKRNKAISERNKAIAYHKKQIEILTNKINKL